VPVDETVPPELEGIDEDLQELKLNEYPMISTHDAGTGYEQKLFCNSLNPVGSYAVCQRGSFSQQLDCGARMFDLRPYKKTDGRLVMHHGGTVFDMEVTEALADVEDWLSTRPTELVILYISKCSGDDGVSDLCPGEASALVKEQGYYVMSQRQSVMGSLTVKNALDRGKQERRPGGGSIVVVYTLGASYYDVGISCYTQAQFPATGENCVSLDPNDRIGRYTALNDYLQYYLNHPDMPFANGTLWNVQAHWQYDVYSIAHGIALQSCILAEESASNINKLVASSIAQEQFKTINILEVDYVCHGGRELYTAARAFAKKYLEKKDASRALDVVEEYAAPGPPAGPKTFQPCYGRAFWLLAPYGACVGVLAAVALRVFRGLRSQRPAGELCADTAVPLAETDAECAGPE
jgi:hypothetical protein